jgi:hypothetical protein
MNERNPERFLEFYLLLLIPVVYTVLGFAGLLFSGAGHGTMIFCEIPSWPFRGVAHGFWFNATILWTCVAVLMVFRDRTAVRLLITVILLIHYSGWWIYGGEHDPYFIRKVWKTLAPAPAFWVSFYAAGQILLWVMLIRSYLKPLLAAPNRVRV